jgi:hypothetical protein
LTWVEWNKISSFKIQNYIAQFTMAFFHFVKCIFPINKLLLKKI